MCRDLGPLMNGTFFSNDRTNNARLALISQFASSRLWFRKGEKRSPLIHLGAEEAQRIFDEFLLSFPNHP